MGNITHMVVGFFFDNELNKVVLIKKNRPVWQKGKINGVGGHVEDGEKPVEAMVREFKEEAGLRMPDFAWTEFLILTDDKEWCVHFFRTFGSAHLTRSMTDEKLTRPDINELPENVIYNLNWIIPMALDKELKLPVYIKQPTMIGD